MRHISNLASKQKKKEPTGIQQQPKVLLVDDDEFNHFAIKSMLQIYDLQLDFSKTHHDALQKVTNRISNWPTQPAYQLIIFDQKMSVIDGQVLPTMLQEIIKNN